ncbi:MAG: hypothetical protein PHQ01_01245 [Candidatus Pacebacteria bacterium]|jgi:hypothetical protein|nr:hypothetical protein [Candidatus Paceibacterota bacterium]
MTFINNENPIGTPVNGTEKIFSLRDVPKDVIEKANTKLESLTKNEKAKLESYGSHGKIIQMMSKASIYRAGFAGARA